MLWRTKGNRPDRVILGREIRDHLRRYLGCRASGPLFPSRNGRAITVRHAARRLRRWLSGAGIDRPASLHSLRHSFALGLYERTGDIALVQEALHHRSIVSTLVYARADEGRLRAAMG